MAHELLPDDLGEPALKIAGFQLWIHGRQFPGAEDYDDGNWLHVTAHCGASGASIWTDGAIVMVTDIESFAKQCEALLRGRAAAAALPRSNASHCFAKLSMSVTMTMAPSVQMLAPDAPQ